MQYEVWLMQLAVNRCWKRPFDFPTFFYIQIFFRVEIAMHSLVYRAKTQLITVFFQYAGGFEVPGLHSSH